MNFEAHFPRYVFLKFQLPIILVQSNTFFVGTIFHETFSLLIYAVWCPHDSKVVIYQGRFKSLYQCTNLKLERRKQHISKHGKAINILYDYFLV